MTGSRKGEGLERESRRIHPGPAKTSERKTNHSPFARDLTGAPEGGPERESYSRPGITLGRPRR
jgi:hypothetical protein